MGDSWNVTVLMSQNMSSSSRRPTQTEARRSRRSHMRLTRKARPRLELAAWPRTTRTSLNGGLLGFRLAGMRRWAIGATLG
jgi:hypothetical protein